MAGISIVAEAKKLFFDAKGVAKSMDAKARSAMARQGGYIRTVARRSMLRRRGPSPAGTPPSVHQGALKNLLFFAFDPGKRSLVVGPAPFEDKAAPLQEFGGTASRTTKGGRRFSVRLPARPFMGPALTKSIAKFPDHWRGSVRS